MSYKLVKAGAGPDFILRLADGAIIPPDNNNTDYQEYQKWQAAGNTPQPTTPVVEPLSRGAKLRALRDSHKKALAGVTTLPQLKSLFADVLDAIAELDS